MSLAPECRATPAAPSIADDKFIEGRAAVFYDANDPGTEYRFRMASPSNPKGEPIEVRERIMPGAFDKALAQDDVRCLYNHEGLLGRRSPGRTSNTLTLTVDAKGLNYRCELPSHALGQQVKESLSRGDLDGSSFQFVPREVPEAVTWRQESTYLVRELRDLRLLDVAPVDFPAYKSTTAGLRAEARSADEEQQLQQLLTPPAPEVDRRQIDADAMALLQLQLNLLPTA
jgi:HK97 family phage prohead protease